MEPTVRAMFSSSSEPPISRSSAMPITAPGRWRQSSCRPSIPGTHWRAQEAVITSPNKTARKVNSRWSSYPHVGRNFFSDSEASL